jgi:hypothetical protein
MGSTGKNLTYIEKGPLVLFSHECFKKFFEQEGKLQKPEYQYAVSR